MGQLSLLEMPRVPGPGELTPEQLAESKASLEIIRELVTGQTEEPCLLGPEFYDDSVTRAVLLVNRRQRNFEEDGGDPEVIRILISAQDWLCRELPEWCHEILREW